MRKVTLTVLGLAGLSLLLCGDATDTRVQGTMPGDVRVGTSPEALPGTQAPGATGTGGAGTVGTPAATGTQAPGTTGTGGGTGTLAAGTEQATGGAGASMAELQQSVVQLQGELAQVRAELTQTRAELARVTASMGVGGSGQSGVAPSAGSAANQGTAGGLAGTGTASSGTTPPGTPAGSAAQGMAAPPGGPDRGTDTSGEAVVEAIYTGTVRSVSAGRLVLLDERGQPFTVELGERTRVLRDGQRISAQQLKPGTRVRATVDLLAGTQQAKEVTFLSTR
ncbi:hypothetical protein [Hyalangium sp.]|uniref:hypothetical protein n=1 Tax=Hyalangium sp. TaxID=2028555 RepID=UPI002D3A21E1|nr:hypothetical protein [Hyalangium sp.]HYH95406.1 hypothetical protein [Hyalangium sp.]